MPFFEVGEMPEPNNWPAWHCKPVPENEAIIVWPLTPTWVTVKCHYIDGASVHCTGPDHCKHCESGRGSKNLYFIPVVSGSNEGRYVLMLPKGAVASLASIRPRACPLDSLRLTFRRHRVGATKQVACTEATLAHTVGVKGTSLRGAFESAFRLIGVPREVIPELVQAIPQVMADVKARIRSEGPA